MEQKAKASTKKRARAAQGRTAQEPFGCLLEQVLEALGAAAGVIDAGILRRAAEGGEEVARRGTAVMDAFAHWLESWSASAPEPEASVRLQRAAGDFFTSMARETGGRYLGLPPLGLAREAQLKARKALDAYHRLVASLTEFSSDFSLPFYQTLGRLHEIAGPRGREIESADDLYQALRAACDGQYQAYLGSARGVRQVAGLVERYLEFKKAMDDALAPLLRFCGLPAKEDMDAVYFRLHRLQKRHRDLQARFDEQAAVVGELQRRLRRLEAAAAEPPKRAAGRRPKAATGEGTARVKRKGPAADAEKG